MPTAPVTTAPVTSAPAAVVSGSVVTGALVPGPLVLAQSSLAQTSWNPKHIPVKLKYPFRHESYVHQAAIMSVQLSWPSVVLSFTVTWEATRSHYVSTVGLLGFWFGHSPPGAY